MSLSQTVKINIKTPSEVVEYCIHIAAAYTIPIMRAAAIAGEMIVVTAPPSFKQFYVDVIQDMVRSVRLMPMITLQSHKEVLGVVELCRAWGFTDAQIADGFAGWTEHVNWAQLFDYEYLYQVHCQMEELVDFKKFFADYTAEKMEKCANKYPCNSMESYVEMIKFFEEFPFESCFDKNNEEIEKKLTELHYQRAKSWSSFLICPHDNDSDYFRYTPIAEETWPSSAPKPAIAAVTITDHTTARDRLEKFAYGRLAFLREEWARNVIVAGGSVTKVLAIDFDPKHHRQADIDLFIFAENHAEHYATLEKLLKYFDGPSTYFAINNSVITVYIKDIPRKFQIISSAVRNPLEILNNFDISHIQWCFWADKGKFYGTTNAIISMRDKVTRLENRVKKTQLGRLIKALHCGYDLHKESFKELSGDIQYAFAHPDHMQKMLRDIHRYYYPRSDPELDDAELHQHILAMIEQDAATNIVATNVGYVIENTVVAGDFTVGYATISYTAFNPAAVHYTGRQLQGWSNTTLRVKSRKGIIRLASGPLMVTGFVVNDDSDEITVKVHSDEPPFAEFCRVLENQILGMYVAGGPTKHIIDADGDITLSINQNSIDSAIRRGSSILQTYNGKPLVMEEDLTVGDICTMCFSLCIKVESTEGTRIVKLMPNRIVKDTRGKTAPCVNTPVATTHVVHITDSSINYE